MRFGYLTLNIWYGNINLKIKDSLPQKNVICVPCLTCAKLKINQSHTQHVHNKIVKTSDISDFFFHLDAFKCEKVFKKLTFTIFQKVYLSND